MSCTDTEPLWLAFSDGRMSKAEEDRFRTHLGTCEKCSLLAENLARLELDLEGLAEEAVEPPPYLKARVLARLAEAKPARFWNPFRFLSSRTVLATSVACLAFAAGLLAREVHRVNEWLRKDRAQEVVLEYQAPSAQVVSLAGDFNGWGKRPGRIRGERVGGRWVFRLELEPGRYQYAFVVDGKKWLPDPRAAGIIPDGFGGMNSVLYVQEQGAKGGRSL